MKKAVSVLLAFTLMISAVAAAKTLTALAAPGDTNTITAKVDLAVGRYNSTTNVFTPLAAGETIALGDVITVRIIPKTDYLVGASSYVVMFDKTFFTVQNTNKAAFLVNTDTANIDMDNVVSLPGYTGNHYYDFACTNFSGATLIPDGAWPASFAAGEKYDKYKAIKCSTQADSNSLNGGSPEVIGGNWLFQFKLKANVEIPAGTDARIWTDTRWFRTNSNTGVDGYIPKCLNGDLASNAKNTYDFKFDFTGADIRLPLKQNQEPTTTPTTAAGTTRPPATSATAPGQTTTQKPTVTATTKPGDTAASTDLTQTTGIPATTAQPVKVPQEDLDAAADKAGIKDWDGNIANLTPEQKEDVQGYLEEKGKDVEVRDDGFYYVETTIPGETATNADGSPAATDSSDDDGVTRSQKIIIVVAAVAAALGIAVVAVILARKKK